MSDSNRGERDKDLGQGFAILTSIALCCAIASIVTYAWTRHSSSSDQRADYYQAEAERNSKAICIGREGGLLAECREEQRRTSRDAYTAEQDLQAQRDMSLWAFWVFIVSAVTAGLTLWALWYVRGTLAATLEVVKDTNEATEAMREANRIAKQSARRQARAYIFVKSVGVQDDVLGGGGLQVLLEVQNAGQTPGTTTAISANVSWFCAPKPVELLDHKDDVEIRIHAGCPQLIPFNLPKDLSVFDADGLLVVMGRIDYVDVFGKEYAEPFSFRSPTDEKRPLWDHQIPHKLAAFPLSTIGHSRSKISRRKKQNTKNEDELD